MARESTIRVLRSTGSTDPTGLTFGELAYTDANGKLFMGTTAGTSLWIGAGITTGGIATNSATLVPTQSAVKSYVDGVVGGGSVVNSFNGTGGAITLTGSGAILYTQSGITNTISARLATTGVTGVASFNSASFDVSAGADVTIKTGGVTNGHLLNSSVTVTAGNGLAGGGAVVLGGTITLTNAGVTGVASFNTASFAVSAGADVTIKSGGVSNAQLVNSSHPISAGGASTLNLGDTLTLTGGSNITLSNTANTVTLGLANDIVIAGNLTVNGTVVTANVDSFIAEDSMFALGTGNAADSLDIGFYGIYTNATHRSYSGLFRDASDGGKYKMYTGLTGAEPTTTVNTAAAGYAVATLVVNIDGGTF